MIGGSSLKRNRSARLGAAVGPLVVLLACGAPFGCAASGPSAAEPLDNSLSQLEPREFEGSDAFDPIDLDEAYTPNMDEMSRIYREFAELSGNGSQEPDDAMAPIEFETADSSDESAEAPEPEQEPEAVVVAEAEPEPDPVVPVETPEEQIARLASELELVLRESSDDPYRLAIRLAGLIGAEPGLEPHLESVISVLPEDQRAVAEAVGQILRSASTEDEDASGDLVDVLLAQAAVLDEARPVRIGHLALCSRVEGFGRYRELPSTAFLAGSPMRMIIYTEVEHFDRVKAASRRNGREADTRIDEWEVRLSVELQLYHESDGLLAWARPEQVDHFRSRSRIRDYFLVDQVQLPRSLTVGAYRLKVILRDLADNSVDERIIPIRVVADPALAGAAVWGK